MRLVLIAWIWMFSSVVSVCQAQAEPESEPPAEVWLSRTLKDQRRMDILGRYVAAPANVLVGGTFAILPVLRDTSLASSIAYVGAGAFMLTSAIAVWANEEPDEARRQAALWLSLGMTSFGTGLLLSCATGDDLCPRPGLGRRLQVGVGIYEIGLFVTNTMLTLLMPPPSASALELSVRNLSPSERHVRVLDFLERRDRQRRVSAYVAAPWGLALGTHLLVEGAGADSLEGKAWLYGLGASFIAFHLIMFLYEQLRTGDADRLRANEYP